jgi:hypothetical protein
MRHDDFVGLLFDPGDEGSQFLWNVDELVPDYRRYSKEDSNNSMSFLPSTQHLFNSHYMFRPQWVIFRYYKHMY